MTAPPEIALTQLALWYDPSRIQTWPAFLGSVPDDVVAGSPTDLGRRFATQRMTSERHSSAFNLVRNLPGLERRGGRLQLTPARVTADMAAAERTAARLLDLSPAVVACGHGAPLIDDPQAVAGLLALLPLHPEDPI